MITIGHKNGIIEQKSLNSITQIVKDMPAYTVIGGEFAIASDDDNIGFETLLGSCVAIMFYDSVTRIKGMNHFLLPSTYSSNDDMKYGLFSVESMLNEMYKLGCKKENMSAKIAGGADIMNLTSGSKSIGYRNVEFAHTFCRSEGFRILSDHTRGTRGRIILLGNRFETFIKNIDNTHTSCEVATQEKILQTELSVSSDTTMLVEFF
jgi:chemotaxis protein CheD